MITPSYGLTATERVLPKLALDFTTASLDSRVTFTRTGNTATVVNSSGYIATINANLPRFDFNPITLACNGLLIEEARTNLFLYSAKFDETAFWQQANLTPTTNSVLSPNGGTSSFTLTDNTTSGAHRLFCGVTIVSGTTYSQSLYVKENTHKYVYLGIASAATANNYILAIFDLDSKTMSQSSVGSSSGTITATSITNAGNGWYRIVLSGSVSVTDGLVQIGFVPTATGNTFTTSGRPNNYAGTGTSLYIWGAQLEAGAFATSYIPTTTTSLTRNADVATMTGTNFSNWYTATTGAASVLAIPQTTTGTRPLIQFDDATANEIISLRGNVANPELYIVDGGAVQAQLDAGTIVANTAYKLTGTWNTNSCAAAQNGAAVVTDNTATIPALTQLRIGSNGTNYVCAWVQKVMYWPQRLINAEVQSFSK
jgi:hypothetical protein